MKEKSVRFVVFGLVLVLLASAAVGTASAFSNSGGVDWKYYKEITVKDNSGKTLTDFQVLVDLNPSNFPANAKSDGSDLRFEDSNGEESNYWIEEWYYPNNAKIWVKVPSIPANGETKIRMYYGNPSASAVSDGDKVFEFFDDFESGSVSDRWLVTRGTFEASTDYAVSGTYAGKWCGGYSHPIHEGAYFDFGLRTNDFVLEYLYRDGGADEGAVFGTCHDTSFSWDLWGQSMLYDWKNTLICRDASDTDHTVVDPFKDVWYKFKETHHPSTKTYDLEIDSGDTYSGIGFEYHEQKNPQYFKIIDPSSGSRSIVSYVDDIFVRKYTSPEPTPSLSAEYPTTKSTPTAPCVYYEEDFETNPSYTSLAPEYAYWNFNQGNYYVTTYDNLAHKYWAYSPEFSTEDTNQDRIVELDMKCENLDWGTYPGVAFYYDNPDTMEGYVFRVEFHWDDHYGKNLVVADSYKHTHWANAPPRSNVWYHVKLKYHASTQKLDIYITEKSTGESFFIKENADFRIDPFCYLGMGYYDEPDYGNEWSPIRVDNIRIAAIGKPALTPTPTPTPPTAPAGKIKAIWLYNQDKYDTPTLMTDLKSAGINTIFLSTDVNNIWKYERFVKSAHENDINVHAMILEDPRCALKENHASSIKAVETVLDYNDKSLAKFDGINIDTEPYVDLDLEQVWQDYITLLEAIHEKTKEKTVLSADIPRWYDESKIKDLAPNGDFFVIMAYDSGDVGWNTASEIEDAVASEMGAIRGEGSKAAIGIGVHERFKDKEAVEKCVDELYSYYSGDPAFLGVSIFKYESYSGLASAPEVTVPTGEEKGIRGFEAIFAVAGLLAVAYIFRRRK